MEVNTMEQLNQPNVKENKKKRESNLELFRIIVMLLIIAHHYVANSGLMSEQYLFAAPTSLKSIFLFSFAAFGKIGINCFVLITAFFMCEKSISHTKFFKLLFEIMFYKIVIGAIFILSSYEPLTLKNIIKCLIPFQSVTTNFTGCYLLFFLCIPFLNILIKNLNRKQHILLIALSCFIYVILGSIPKFQVSMNYVSWYIVLYFIGSFIKMYPHKMFDSKKIWGSLSLLSSVLCIVSIVIMAYVKPDQVFFFVMDCNKILALVTGISWFMFFKNIKIRYSKFINAVASTTFGVLLIHANSDFMRQWLWQDTLKNLEVFSTNWVYLHALLSILGIFILCSVIDFIRQKLIEKPFMKWWDKILNKIIKKFSKKETELSN